MKSVRHLLALPQTTDTQLEDFTLKIVNYKRLKTNMSEFYKSNLSRTTIF